LSVELQGSLRVFWAQRVLRLPLVDSAALSRALSLAQE
jgi:hypothetical protein